MINSQDSVAVNIPDVIPNIAKNQLTITRKLAEGSQGTVYLGFYKTDAVALKQFKREKEYYQEQDILRSLNHPNIIKLLGYIEKNVGTRKARGLVFALATRGTLQKYLDINRGQYRTQEECVQYARDLSQGVYYLHSERVLHGDLKPINALILDDGTLVLNDFAFSRRLKPGSDEISIPGTFGSLSYKPADANEDNNYHYTLAYDIYALAWILYLLTTDNETDPYFNDSQHFEERHRADLHKKNVHPTIPDTASPILASLILSGMNQNPLKRPTAVEVLEIVTQENIEFRPSEPISTKSSLHDSCCFM